ncbi:MAG TPA: preprotein translocase subunit SecY, partial [bacterium]|nr:preprotein translocase subunit SecY [bacterium]
VFNTDELAENLQKQGAFIQGIRPGKKTAEFLRKASFKLTAVGAIFLAFLAVLPGLLVKTDFVTTSIFSGTGLIIVVGAVIEIKTQLESMIVAKSYQKYL